MRTFMYGVGLQWQLDLRNKEVLITYYVVPLVFFLFMGGIFTSINPIAKETLIQSMTVFGVTMGAILGSPAPLVELYGSEIKKAYKIGGIPLWAGAVNNFLSAFVHLFIMSAAIFFVSPIAFDATAPSNVPVYFLSLAIFIAVCISVGTTLGLFVKSASKLTMLSQLIFLPSLMLSGIMFSIDLLPKPLEIVGKAFPATWGFKLMSSMRFDIYLLIPLIVIFTAAIILSGYRLAKIAI